MSDFINLWKLFPKDYRVKFYILIFLVIFGSLLETIGIGLLFPLFLLLTNDTRSPDNGIIQIYLNFFGNSPSSMVIISTACFIGLLFVAKNVVLCFVYLIRSRFVFGLRSFFSIELMQRYILQPYEFHINEHSSILLRNITVETQHFALKYFQSIMSLISEIPIIFLLLVLLFVMQPLATILIVVILLFSILTYQYFTAGILNNISQQRMELEGQRTKAIQEIFRSIKEIKMSGTEYGFHQRFSKVNRRLSWAEQKFFTLGHLPRIWLETIFVVVLVICIINFHMTDNQFSSVLPSISIFAAAAIRIIPSGNRIMIALQASNYAKNSLQLMVKTLNDKIGVDRYKHDRNTQQKKIHKLKKQISLKNVSFKYPGSQASLFTNMSFTIQKGEFFGIVGESGAGKSTLINLISGLLEPNEGLVLVDHVDIRKNLRNWQNEIGYVSQEVILLDSTLKQNVAFGVSEEEIDEDRVKEVLKEASVHKFINNITSRLDENLGEDGIKISGGQRQRIGIARALYHRPSLIIFDEATSALDVDTEKEILEEIEKLKRKVTLISISHRPQALTMCDKVFEISNEKIR